MLTYICWYVLQMSVCGEVDMSEVLTDSENCPINFTNGENYFISGTYISRVYFLFSGYNVKYQARAQKFLKGEGSTFGLRNK